MASQGESQGEIMSLADVAQEAAANLDVPLEKVKAIVKSVAPGKVPST